MALNTRDDIFTEFLVRNNRTTSDAFITEQMLKDWYKQANIWGSSQHKWPFTEGRVETTFAAGTGSNADEYFFEGYKADSFRLIQIGGKRLRKLNFEDYQIQQEKEGDSDERVWSDFHRTVFINPDIDASGTLVAYGQIQPEIDVTDETGVTVFSNDDEEGNEAIVEKMSSYLKRREHLTEEAELHDNRSRQKLDEVWKRVLDEQHKYQTHPSRGGMFERIDVLRGALRDDLFKRDQFT